MACGRSKIFIVVLGTYFKLWGSPLFKGHKHFRVVQGSWNQGRGHTWEKHSSNISVDTILVSTVCFFEPLGEHWTIKHDVTLVLRAQWRIFWGALQRM